MYTSNMFNGVITFFIVIGIAIGVVITVVIPWLFGLIKPWLHAITG